MSSRHIQTSFDKDIKSIRERIVLMAEMVSNELEETINAFADRDETLAVESVFREALERWFGTIFWFAVLGIFGAALYRLWG